MAGANSSPHLSFLMSKNDACSAGGAFIGPERPFVYVVRDGKAAMQEVASPPLGNLLGSKRPQGESTWSLCAPTLTVGAQVVAAPAKARRPKPR